MKRRPNNSFLSALQRCATAGAAVVLLCGVVGWEQPAEAGGPLIVGGPTLGTEGVPFVWSTASPVAYSTDQGGLGSLNNTDADNLVQQAFMVWEAVPTATISFASAGELGMDVTGTNAVSFFETLGNCSQPSTITNAIVYDTDGSVIDAILGENESRTVLGFASALCISTAGGNRITRGRAVLNGRFIDNMPNPELPGADKIDKFKEVFTHEFGHLIGLDHSQLNVEVLDPAQRDEDSLFGLPLMFPFLFGSTPARVTAGFPPLAPDDEAWVSFLYPATPDFNNSFGRIEGRIFFSDGVTPVQGANVIARQVDDPDPAVKESRRFAVSVVSGYKFTGNPGQSVTGTNTGGSPLGSRDPTLIGFYEIPTRPGDYTVEVESIFEEFTEGSSVGPFGEPIPLPGPAEFHSPGESATDFPDVPATVTVSANATVTLVDIILNGTLPRFDVFESARLWWREPAPAWLRERRPAALLVTG